MPSPKSKYYRIPPAIGTTGPEPFQSFDTQGMRQLPTIFYPGAIVAGINTFFDVIVGPNTFADGKHLIVSADMAFNVNVGGPPIGLKFNDVFVANGTQTASFNTAAASALPAIGAYFTSFCIRWDLVRVVNSLKGSLLNDAYTRIPGTSSVAGVSTALRLDPAVGFFDWTVSNTFSFGLVANMAAPNVLIGFANVRALIESPVNIGRAPL